MLQRHGYEDVLGKVPDYYWPRMRDHLKPLQPHAIPCLLFGDECQALGSSYMVLTWMSEVNPVMTDSLFSRHIITLIPAERYHIVDGVNITLMAAMREIILSFQELSSKGVGGMFCEVTGVKGDWKFHKQVALLKRHYSTNLCCHLCMATKNLVEPFTNLASDAGWRATILDPNLLPWETPPSLTQLRNFNPSFLLPDLLHVWYLGVGRDIVASCMVSLVRSGNWAGANQVARFWTATCSFKRFLVAQGLPNLPKRWKFTKTKINMKGGQVAHFKEKGHRTGLVLKWLFAELDANGCDNHHLQSLLWAAHHVMGLLSSKKLFLTREEGSQICSLGEFMLKQYLHLHHQRVGSVKLWHIRPKWHLLHHIFLSCETTADFCRNPHSGVCWMDEDFLKKMMTVTKKCHKLTANSNTLKRYLLGLKEKIETTLRSLRTRQSGGAVCNALSF